MKTQRMRSELEQYPFVNVFKVPSFDVERKLGVRGDVFQATDAKIQRRVWVLKGDTPSNNTIVFPKDPTESLRLTGRFVYLMVRGHPNKCASLHIEVATVSGPTVRITFSTMVQSDACGVTQVKLPFGDLSRWTVLAVDMEALLAKHHPSRQFRFVKAFTACSSLYIRTVLTSSLVYTPTTLPHEAGFPSPTGSTSWSDAYSWRWIPQPPGSSAPLAEPPANISARLSPSPSRGGSVKHTAPMSSAKTAHSSKHAHSQAANCMNTNSNAKLARGKSSERLAESRLSLSCLLTVEPEGGLFFCRSSLVLYCTAEAVAEVDLSTREQRFYTWQKCQENAAGTSSNPACTLSSISANHARTFLVGCYRAVPAEGEKDTLNSSCVTREITLDGSTLLGSHRSLSGLDSMTGDAAGGSGACRVSAVFWNLLGKSAQRGKAFQGDVKEVGSYSFPRSVLARCGVMCVSDGATVLFAGVNDKRKTALVLMDVSRPSSPSVIVKQHVDAAGVCHAVFVPNETDKFVTCDGNTTSLRVWRVRDGVLRSRNCPVVLGTSNTPFSIPPEAKPGGIAILAFATARPTLLPDDRLILYAGCKNGVVCSLNFTDFTLLSSVAAHAGPIRSIAPSGGLCASCATGDDWFRVWSLDLARLEYEQKLAAPAVRIDASRDGLTIAATTADRRLLAFEYHKKEARYLLDGHNGAVTAVKCHPYKPVVATASVDATICLWDTQQLQCLVKLDMTTLITTPAAKSEALMESGSVTVPEHYGDDISFANTSRRLPVSEQGREKSARAKSREAKNEGAAKAIPLCLDWLRDERQNVLACGFDGGAVRLFDMDHQCLLCSYAAHAGSVIAVLFTKNQKWLASMDQHGICFADAKHGYYVSRASLFSSVSQEVRLAESTSGDCLLVIAGNGSVVSVYEAAYGLEVGYIQDFASDAQGAGCITDLACGIDDAGANVVAVLSSDGHVTHWALPPELPEPPPPDERDYGVIGEPLNSVRLHKTWTGCSARFLMVSPSTSWAVMFNTEDALRPYLAVSPFPIPAGCRPARHHVSCSVVAADWTVDEAFVVAGDRKGGVSLWEFQPPMLTADEEASNDVEPLRSASEEVLGRGLAAGSEEVSEEVSQRSCSGDVAEVWKEVGGEELEHRMSEEHTSRDVRRLPSVPSRLSRVALSKFRPPDPTLSGLTLSASYGSCGAAVGAVAPTGTNGLVTASCGVVVVDEEVPQRKSELLVNDGFVTAMAVFCKSGDPETRIAVGLYYSKADGSPRREMEETASLCVWTTSGHGEGYHCSTREDLPFQSVRNLSWSPDGTSVLSLCVGGFSFVCYPSLSLDTSADTPRSELSTVHRRLALCSDLNDLTAMRGDTGWVCVGGSTIFCLAPCLQGTQAQTSVAGNLLSCASDPRKGRSFFWTGSEQGAVACFLLEEGEPLALKVFHLHCGPVTSICFYGPSQLYACVLPTDRDGASHDQVMQLSVTTESTPTKTVTPSPTCAIVSTISQLPCSGLKRAKPVLVGNSPEGQCLLAGDEGNAVSLANGTAMLLQDRPQFADEVTRLACCDGLFAAASRSGVAVWHVNNALLAGCEAREGASFCAVALHRKLGVILGDSTGCLSVLGADGTPTLKERARWRLSESPLVSLTWCFGSELLALDEAMNIYYIDLLHPTEATVVFEASDNIPRGQSAFSDGSSIESACSARHLVLLHSVTNHQLTLIRRTQATPTPTPSVPAFSAIACLQLDTPPLSAHLTPCGDCIAYLATSTLILFDYESQTERALQLHSPFTSFSLSPDNVYALLWGGTSEARLSLYDLQYATFQEISGHTLPVQSCTFTPSGEHLFSVASSEHHFELFDWKVKQLAE